MLRLESRATTIELMKKKYYLPPDADRWQGRIDSPAPERWHQAIQLIDLSAEETQPSGDIAILGFACDEGVRRNKGRTGAAEAPEAIRKALGSMAAPHRTHLIDAGDVVCPGEKLAKAQRQLAKGVETLFAAGLKPVVLGGGHETAYGSWSGLRWAIPDQERIGIINLDAHFDLRSDADGPTSGTPFFQIKSECDHLGQDFLYLVLGIDPLANTQTLFDRAKAFGVKWQIQSKGHTYPAVFTNDVRRLASTVDHLYLTIDMDAFAASAAPGVSAVNPLGLFPQAVLPVLTEVAKSGKLRLVDICECNPIYDQDQRTAKLAACLLSYLVSNWQ